jgi:hypothetical protein
VKGDRRNRQIKGSFLQRPFLEEIFRIAGTNLVVERGRLIEGRPEPVSFPGHGPALTGVPQRAETDEQDSGVLRERDDEVGETGLLDCERA